MSRIIKNITLTLILWLYSWVALYPQSCSYTSQANDMKPDKLCAPVTAEWTITYRGVDDGGTGNVGIYIDWDDGTIDGYHPATETVSGNNEWQITASHVYPKGRTQCNYEPRTMLVVDGTLCTSSVQTQLVTVWDEDDKNGGQLNISPKVFPICVGNDGSVQFVDASHWNCTPPYENDVPNDRNRWTQWIYGTGGTTITTAEVNGTVHPWPYTTPVEYYNAPVTAPAPPPSLSETVYVPHGYVVGDFFEVTIRNWNTCNPYDNTPNDGNPPADPVNGDNPPIETTAIALIVDLPDATITPVGPFCDNALPVTLAAATAGGTWSGTGVNPSTGEFDPVAAGPGTHTIGYAVTDSNGCSASSTLDIEVRESPTVTIDAGAALSLCPGITQTLTAQISGGTAPYQSVIWTGDTTPLSATDIADPEFSTLTEGDYNLSVTVTDATGCTGSASITISVQAIVVTFTPATVEVCAGTPIQLQPVVSGGSGNYTTHTWSGTATTKLSATDVAEPIFTSNDVGPVTLNYQVIDDRGCLAQAAITVVVKEQPVAAAGPDELVCGDNYTLQGNLPAGATGLWQVISGAGTLTFSDPTLPDAQIAADTYGSYELSWEVNLNGCSHSDVVTLRFAEVPAPITGDDFMLCGLTATLEATPDMAGGSWSMVSGPGAATFTNPANPATEVTVDTPGSYLFRWSELSPDLCAGNADQEVAFLPQASAMIAPFDNEGCAPLEISFTNQSVNAQTYRWNFGDGATSMAENPTHRFENNTPAPIVHNVTLIARNSGQCNDTLSIPVTVNPSPSARFAADPLAGCSPLQVSFTNNTTGGTSFSWDFGDATAGSSEQNPTHTFINPESYVQSYPVKLATVNSYGCTDTAEVYISVFPLGKLNLTATPDEGCSPLDVTLVADPGFRVYEWDFGDGTTLTGNNFSETHSFLNNGPADASFNATVTGTTALGCRATASVTVTVYPSPNPDFTATPQTLQMPQSTVALQNNTPGTWNYLWNFGDGNTSTEANPASYTYPASGTYPITLEASSAHCSGTIQKTIEVLPMLPAIDYGEDAEGCPPLTVSFYNNTLDATSYIWEFGDGRISDDKEPEHIYQIPGTYTVRLTATGPGGTTVAETVTVKVYDSPTALFEPVPKLIYIPENEVTFLNRSIGATTWLWNFGDGETSGEFMPVHAYQSTGLFDVTLLVENDLGCRDEITVPGAVKAEQGGEMVFPNAFTPNPDGPSDGNYAFGDRQNHVFYPSVQKGIVEYQLQIFSRWGELLFQSNDIKKGWDGYFRNELCPQDVYIWRVKAKFSNGKTTTRAGDVTLLR